MKAVVCTAYGGPEVLEVREMPTPQPQDNEILVKVRAACLSTASAMMRSGTPRYARIFLGLRRPKKPIPGTGFAGVVTGLGKNVTGFEVGDAVFGETTVNFGTNAEYVAVPADGAVLPMPDFLSFEEAAVMCDGPVTSFNFLKNLADVQQGQKVLINGASGSLGVAAVQIAKYMGAEVTGVCSTKNIELVKSIGADHVIDYKKEDFTQSEQQYDVIYDTVGKSCFAKAQKVLTKTGVFMSPVLSFKILLPMLTNKLRNGKRAKFDATGLKPIDTIKKMMGALQEIMKDGKYNHVIERRYAMEQVVDAHRYIDSGRKRGCIVMSI